MLEYIKIILGKVSFSRELFEKELRKAINMLVATEVEELKSWCYAKFSNLYEEILNRNFQELSTK
jgi:hypothetical protein